MQLKVGKSPGNDGIPADVYQHGGEAVLDKLQDLFTNFWEKGTLPQDLRDAVIVSLYKIKGGGGIRLFKLLRHHPTLQCSQILVCVLLNRLIPKTAKENTPENHCGFRSNRETADIILLLKQIQEKCREQNIDLCAAFVNLTKAFDTVSSDGLWKIPARLGYP